LKILKNPLADLGPLPADIELVPVEIYKVYKQISKKSTPGGHLPRFTSKFQKSQLPVSISPFWDPN
jgi:hypothetical protein